MGDEWTASLSVVENHPRYCSRENGADTTPLDSKSLLEKLGESIKESPYLMADDIWIEYHVINQSYRGLAREVVVFGNFLNSHNISLEGNVDMHENLCFVGERDEIKFRGLKFKPSKGNSKLVDLQKIEVLLRQIIDGGNKKKLSFPYEMQHLFCAMKSDKPRNYLVDHFALLPDPVMLESFKDIFPGPLDESKRESYNKAVESMERSDAHLKSWTNWYKNPSSRDPASLCFQYAPRKPSPYLNVNMHILRFIRNLAHHLPQHIGLGCSESDVVRTIMALFSPELCSFQWEAYKRGI